MQTLLPAAQVLARRVRKIGESLRRAVAGEVDALAAGATPLPQDLASWECLSAGGQLQLVCRAFGLPLCHGTRPSSAPFHSRTPTPSPPAIDALSDGAEGRAARSSSSCLRGPCLVPSGRQAYHVCSGGPACQRPPHPPPAAFPSADFLLDELEAVAAEGRRLHSPRLEAALRKAVSPRVRAHRRCAACSLCFQSDGLRSDSWGQGLHLSKTQGAHHASQVPAAQCRQPDQRWHPPTMPCRSLISSSCTPPAWRRR